MPEPLLCESGASGGEAMIFALEVLGLAVVLGAVAGGATGLAVRLLQR